jgi:DeoR family suf operon transcriptional repressor
VTERTSTGTFGPTLANLPATRRALLIAVKRHGERRAEELATELGITVSAIRQHLSGLAASGLVVHRELKDGPGRPKHLYSLTETAEALFPKTYSELTNELLGYVQDDDPALLERIFERRRQRRVEQARERLAGRTFPEQVAELTRILDEDGYLADIAERPGGGYTLTEHNCAILGIAKKHARACTTELSFLREVLPGAEVRRVTHMMAGGHSCAYEIVPTS